MYARLSFLIQIGVHSSNRHPLTSLSQIPVQFKGLLQSAHRSEVQNVCDVEIGHGFEDWTPIRERTTI